jgi:prefoldin subunit 5
MELAYHKDANISLENDVLTQLNNVNEHIKYLNEQIQNFQQQNTQLADEHKEFRIAAMHELANLEVQITQWQH